MLPVGSVHSSRMYSGFRIQKPIPTTSGSAHSSPAENRCCAVWAFSFAAMFKREMALIIGEAEGPLSGRRNHGREALSEDRARTGRVGADELADVEVEADGDAGPGAISNGAGIAAMELG